MKNLLSYRLGIFDNQSSSTLQQPIYTFVLRLIEQFKIRPAKSVMTGRSSDVEKSLATSMVHPQLIEPLSEREREVLILLAKGCSPREVAQTLVFSSNTAKAHIKSIYRKLNVHNRKEAVKVARLLSLLPG